jgi:hypothetical protein
MTNFAKTLLLSGVSFSDLYTADDPMVYEFCTATGHYPSRAYRKEAVKRLDYWWRVAARAEKRKAGLA